MGQGIVEICLYFSGSQVCAKTLGMAERPSCPGILRNCFYFSL